MTAPPHALAAFRIALGIYWLVSMLAVAPHVELLFSASGHYNPMYPYDGDAIDSAKTFIAWCTQAVSPNAAWLIYGLTLTSIVLFTFGLLTKPATLLFLICFTYYWFLYWYVPNSAFHHIAYLMTILLLLSPCDKVFSIDRLIRHRGTQRPVESVPLWTQRLMCFQIAWIYFGTGTYKMISPTWDNGDALKNFLMGYWATPRSFWLVQQELPDGVYNVASMLVILLELFGGFALFHPKLQWPFFVLGISFHLSIAVLLGLWPFMIMPLTYILFIDPDLFAGLVSSTISKLRKMTAINRDECGEAEPSR